MLILGRIPDQSIIIGDDIVIRILQVQGFEVRIGITAPRDVHVLRAELAGTPPRPADTVGNK